MSKTRSVRGAIALAAGALSLVAGPVGTALAEEASPALTATAWYWSSNRRFTFAAKDPVLGFQQKFDLAAGGPVGLVPGGGISPISIGHLGISMINGSSDMRSYARWDLASVPPGSKVQSFVVSFNISRFSDAHLRQHFQSESRPPSTFGDDFAKVDACPVTETLTSSEAEPSSSFSFQRPEIEKQSTDINRKDQRLEPKYDCGEGRIRGALDGTREHLVFDLTTLAQRWVDEPLTNNGVAMIGQAEGLTTTWMLELHGPEYAAKVDTGLPVGAPVPLPEAPEQPANIYVSKADAATSTIRWGAGAPDDGGDDDDGGTTVINEGDTIVNNGGSTTTTTVVQQPGTTAPPQTIYTTIGGIGTLPVGDVTTPGWVFLGFPLGLLALGAISGALGKDELVEGAVPIAGSRVAALLQARRING